MKLSGTVTNKNKIPVKDAQIEIKDEKFQTIYNTLTNENGYYEIITDNKIYPFVTGIKDYAINNLEFWAQNIDLSKDVILDFSFDKLEIYGLHVFKVKGGFPSLLIYFRPMSLSKFQNNEKDICPDIKNIYVKVDDKETKIIKINEVYENCGNLDMKSFLIQVAYNNKTWSKVFVEINDIHNNYGQALIYNN